MKKPKIKQTRNEDTSKGLYTKVRSKFIKGKGGKYGEVVTLAREKAMEKNGGPLPKGSAVHHVNGNEKGADNVKDDMAFEVTTFSDNVRESNMRRGKKSDKEVRDWIAKRARK